MSQIFINRMENFSIENINGRVVLQIDTTEKELNRKITELELLYAKQQGLFLGFW